MTNVLIPTDFSENAWNATRYALEFFESEPTNFFLLHVDNFGHVNSNVTSSTVTNGMVLNMYEDKSVDERLDQEMDMIKGVGSNSNHNFYSLKEGSGFVESVKRSVDENKIDFIVMGTKGASGLKEVTIGTRTSEVITRVKCPILVIPENAKYIRPERIVFPTNFNSFFKNKVLLTLAEILATQDSELLVLHLTQSRELSASQQENKAYLEGFLDDRPHSFHYAENEDIEQALTNFINLMQAQMVAMVAKNISFFEQLLFTPSVARISYHTEIPFLVLHE